MQRVQMMIRTPQYTSPSGQILFPKVITASSCDHPLCAVCRFAKPTRRNPGTIQGIDQVTVTSVKVTCNLEQKFLLINIYLAFQDV
jgi:hypothetical protein